MQYFKPHRSIKAEIPGGENPFREKAVLRVSAIVFFLFALLALAGPPQLFATDYILGQVISVDREKGEFVLRVKQSVDQGSSPGNSGNEDKNGDTPKDVFALITIRLKDEDGHQPFLPGSVQPGEFVRVWGNYIDNQNNDFKAIDIRGTRSWQLDNSGVRSRLGHGSQSRQGAGNHNGGKRRGPR